MHHAECMHVMLHVTTYAVYVEIYAGKCFANNTFNSGEISQLNNVDLLAKMNRGKVSINFANLFPLVHSF